ncbi:MAG: hypothetical protein Q8N03_12595 [Ignavibacteria bacterium]|nr:hypothetical protein [Ignavibacteria bacterium]
MKKIFFVLTVSLIVFMTGCSRQEPNSPNPDGGSGGGVMLKIDRENAPSNVNVVTAVLKKGADSLVGNLDLTSSTSADITFQSVPIGTWHLKVDAKDINNVVVYSGQTSVLVQENSTTQVNLTLVPSATGVGSINLTVTWGNQPTEWTDHYANPIISGNNSSFETGGVRMPRVLLDDGVYKMWFVSLGSSGASSISYATSSNGMLWNRYSNNPVLLPGIGSNGWDSHSITPGAIIRDDSGYKLYYSGTISNSDPTHIGMATSTDGINWVKTPMPILYAGTSWDYLMSCGDVIKIGSVYYMYYSGKSQSNVVKIGLATSTDGINWVKHEGNPILQPSQAWESTGIYSPSVVKIGEVYKLFYANVTNTNIKGFGVATSANGINWVKETSNPFFTQSNTHNNWVDYIQDPSARLINEKVWIYYSGFNPVGYVNSIAVLKHN